MMVPGAKRKARSCRACHEEFVPTGNCQPFCVPCADFRKCYANRLENERRRLRQGRKVGVGSGGANKGGATEHNYREIFLNDLYQIQSGCCADCGEEFPKGKLLVHHIDHNRKHNVLSNLSLVCKRCHQIEHECWLAFRKV